MRTGFVFLLFKSHKKICKKLFLQKRFPTKNQIQLKISSENI